MKLWILLFTLSAAIFGAAVLVWWRITLAWRKQKIVKSLSGNIDSNLVTVQSTVLIEGPAAARGFARFFKSGSAGAPPTELREQIRPNSF